MNVRLLFTVKVEPVYQIHRQTYAYTDLQRCKYTNTYKRLVAWGWFYCVCVKRKEVKVSADISNAQYVAALLGYCTLLLS